MYLYALGFNSFANILWKSKTKEGKFFTLVPYSDNFPNNTQVYIEETRTVTFHGSSNTYEGWVFPGKTIVLTNEFAQSLQKMLLEV